MLKSNNFYKLILVLLAFIFIPLNPVFAELISASLTLPTPDTMSDGKQYYLAGKSSYVFVVTGVNPTATGAASYDYFQVTIPTASGNLVLRWDSDGSEGLPGNEFISNAAWADVVITDNTNWTNLSVTFTVTFYWPAPSTANSPQSITAAVREAGAPTVRTDTKNQSYGIASNIKVYNFTQDGIAADGYISPERPVPLLFNVSGIVVYDIEGYELENASDKLDDGDINTVYLQLVTSAISLTAGGNASFNVAVSEDTITAEAGYYWRVNVDFTDPGADKQSPAANGLPIECNTVRVDSVQIISGFGIDNYRAYNQTGTQVRITAHMRVDAGSGTSMHGDTTFNLHFTDGTDVEDMPITIKSGAISAIATIPNNAAFVYPDLSVAAGFTVTAGTTETWTYSVTAVSGGSHELAQTDDGNGGTPQQAIIYWDNDDPPKSWTAAAPPFIDIRSVNPSATQITFYWVPVDTSVAGAMDRDFYEYRIYIREQGTGTAYRVWSGTEDPELRGLTYNPWPVTANPANQITAIGAALCKYTTIQGLKLFTSYEYYITAVDIFGHEVSVADAGPAVASRSIRTQPFSISIALTDGITRYENESFADLTPAARSLRESNIKVEVSIVASEDFPDSVTVWYATTDTDAQDIVNTANNTVNSFTGLYSAVTTPKTPNLWTAYLPTHVPIIAQGNNIRFIVQTSLNEVSAFSDTNSSSDQDPNGQEWTFAITRETNFQPWPVRILNNVITDKNPVAYPSYYLSEDALVTIRVYDIKGRTVATIMNSAPRKGGVNIKEKGWTGLNKARKKLGVGLYYMHFKATRVTDGKVILNESEKVVIAK